MKILRCRRQKKISLDVVFLQDARQRFWWSKYQNTKKKLQSNVIKSLLRFKFIAIKSLT
jgi:hypothetical protein